MTKKVFLLLLALAAAVGLGAFFGTTASKPADDADTMIYTITVTTTATGNGELKVIIGDWVYSKLSLSGKTADSITIAIPVTAAKELSQQAGNEGLRGEHAPDIQGTGDISGEIVISLTTPFGILRLYDKEFHYGTPPNDILSVGAYE